MPSTEPPTVPKFGSFKPRVDRANEAVQSTGSSSAHAGKGGPKSSLVSVDSHRRKPTSDIERTRRRPTHERGVDKLQAREAERPRPVAPLASAGVHRDFVIDVKGDASNITFGSLHKYSVPVFRRAGAGSVLGNPDGKIDRAQSDHKATVIETSYDGVLGTGSPFRSKDWRQTEALVYVRPNNEVSATIGGDYLALTTSRKRKRRSDPEVSITIVHSDGENESNSSGMDEDGSPERAGFVDRGLDVELARRTNREPNNVQAWIDLADSQSTLLSSNLSSRSTTLSMAQQKSLADMRLSIYERSLQMSDKKNPERHRLWLGLLDEAKKFWDHGRLKAKWTEALRECGGSIRLWTRRLDFIQTSYSQFRYENVRDEFIRCLHVLKQLPDPSNSGSSARNVQEATSAYVFLRLTAFMRDAGYHELAEALWQAVLEVSFFRHQVERVDNANDTSGTELLSGFESFWESEAARIGEPGAKGWSSYDSEDTEPPEGILHGSTSLPNKESIFKDLEQSESTITQQLLQPGRTMDEGLNDDPYHVVLYSDLRPVLDTLDLDSLSPMAVLQAWLCYQGLSPLYNDSLGAASVYWDDALLWLGAVSSKTHPAAPGRDGVFSDYFSHIFATIPGCLRFGKLMTPEMLFTEGLITPQSTRGQWVLRVLKSLCEATQDNDELAEYYLAAQLAIAPESAEREAKALLAKRRSSTRLYNAYALILLRLGRRNEATSVFRTLCGGLTTTGKDNLAALYCLRSWVWSCLLPQEDCEAASVQKATFEAISSFIKSLCQTSPPDDATQIPPALILKTKRTLAEFRERLMSARRTPLLATVCELNVLFAYLASQLDLTSALESFKHHVALLKTCGYETGLALEELQQKFTQLMVFHASRVKVFKASTLREFLRESVSQFPSNCIFTTAFIANESRFEIWEQVRPLLTALIDKPHETKFRNLLLQVWYETERVEKHGRLSPLVRAAYQKAVEHPKGEHSIVLWTAYLDYELKHGQSEVAKAVFLRGMQKLPWSKSFILHGLSTLSEVCTVPESKSIFRLLNEEQLRMHLDVEEIVDQL